MNDARISIIDSATGRDLGKRYRLNEIDPLTMANYMLRLGSAIKADDIEALVDDFKAAGKPEAGANVPVELLMQALQGCDAERVHALMTDLLTHVEVAVDPRHPEAFRAMDVKVGDIRELTTLGTVLMGVLALNLG